MLADILRRVALVALVGFIVGGLWVLAKWKADLDDPQPSLFSRPLFPTVSTDTIPSFSNGSQSGDVMLFDQVLFEDDQIIRVS